MSSQSLQFNKAVEKKYDRKMKATLLLSTFTE